MGYCAVTTSPTADTVVAMEGRGNSNELRSADARTGSMQPPHYVNFDVNAIALSTDGTTLLCVSNEADFLVMSTPNLSTQRSVTLPALGYVAAAITP